jgi:hypothetical protein
VCLKAFETRLSYSGTLRLSKVPMADQAFTLWQSGVANIPASIPLQ